MESEGQTVPEVEELPDWQYVLLRTVEVVFAGSVLVLTLPITLLIALIIRLDSPGPALFRQSRLGKGGLVFHFYKFRTLYADARERFPELYEYKYSADEISRLTFKLTDDPRVTRVGRWLRKSTLDELPNFLNVLIGNVALVGPRPEIPEMWPYYAGDELLKFSVRPGVTGLAQTSGRGSLSFQETARLDSEYVKSRSLAQDLRIILQTVTLVVKRDGAF